MHALRIKSWQETRKAVAEVRLLEAQVDTEVDQPHVLRYCAEVGIPNVHRVIWIDPRWTGRSSQIQRSPTCWTENELLGKVKMRFQEVQGVNPNVRGIGQIRPRGSKVTQYPKMKCFGHLYLEL